MMYDQRLCALLRRHAIPPSRAKTVTITVHTPKDVRDRLKILAVKLDRTMNELMAEALQDLFMKHDG